MRLRRAQRIEHNRELLLEAARRVFLAKGYAGASLEAIAEEAGFSKGVVYSQFQSKADLFLALLERRIDERAERNRKILGAEIAAGAGIAEGVALSERLFLAEPEWTLLVVEFRVHAARDPALNRRYAAAHARTVERLAALFTDGLALGIGVELERIADPESLPTEAVIRMTEGILGLRRDDAAEPRPTRRTTRRKRA